MLRIFMYLCMVVTLGASEDIVRYDGYHLIRTVPRNNVHIRMLAALFNDPEVDFWVKPRFAGYPVDIFVSPERVVPLNDYLVKMGLDAQIIMINAQPLIEDNKMAESDVSELKWRNDQELHKVSMKIEVPLSMKNYSGSKKD